MTPLLRVTFSPRTLLTAALLGALALGCNKAAEPTEEAKPAIVKAVPAEEESFGQWTELLGTTMPLPNRAARVTAAVEGRINAVLSDAGGHSVAEGQRVEAGQVLARLDDQVVLANKARLEAQLREFEQQKVQARIAVETAQIDAKRYEDLSREAATANSISPAELKKAQLALQNTRSMQEGVLAKEQSARADLKAIEAQLGFYTIKAPIAGRLGVIQVQRGQTLTPGAVVTDVIDLDEIDALCYVPPEVAARLRVEQFAVIVAQDSSSRFKTPILFGEVVFVAQQASPDTGNFAVKVRFLNQDFRHRLFEQALHSLTGVPIRLPDDDRALRANAVVRVRVLTEEIDERMSVPDDALLEDRSPPAVVTVQDLEVKKGENNKEERTGKARVLTARLGVRDRSQRRAEVLELIDPKTKKSVPLYYDAERKKPVLFITEGGHGLRDGDQVKIEAEEEEDKKD